MRSVFATELHTHPAAPGPAQKGGVETTCTNPLKGYAIGKSGEDDRHRGRGGGASNLPRLLQLSKDLHGWDGIPS